MSQSHKRHTPSSFHRPSRATKQRTKTRMIWAILFGVFGLAMAFFASGNDPIALIIGTLIGASIGFIIARSLEQA